MSRASSLDHVRKVLNVLLRLRFPRRSRRSELWEPTDRTPQGGDAAPSPSPRDAPRVTTISVVHIFLRPQNSARACNIAY